LSMIRDRILIYNRNHYGYPKKMSWQQSNTLMKKSILFFIFFCTLSWS